MQGILSYYIASKIQLFHITPLGVRAIVPEENCPPRLGLGFGIGLGL